MPDTHVYQTIFGASDPTAATDRDVFAAVARWMRSRGDAPRTKDESLDLAYDALRRAAMATDGLGRDDGERARLHKLAVCLASARAMTAVGNMLWRATRAHR